MSRRSKTKRDLVARSWHGSGFGEGQVPLLAVQFGELGEESNEVLEDLLWQAMDPVRGRTLAGP